MPATPMLRKPMHLPPWALAVAGPLIFGSLDVAAVLTEAGRTTLHNPTGLFAIGLARLLGLAPATHAFGL